jgi:uncharacterized membrane protein
MDAKLLLAHFLPLAALFRIRSINFDAHMGLVVSVGHFLCFYSFDAPFIHLMLLLLFSFIFPYSVSVLSHGIRLWYVPVV